MFALVCYQVDRVKLKTKLLERCMKQGVGFISSAVDTVDHGSNQAARSKVVLQVICAPNGP